ncbi:MAG: PilZ domain-containing protein [Xanthobacteraceae bacterium]
MSQHATQEHRRFHRVAPSGLVSKTGTLFADLKSPPIVCNIVDLSAGGACLDVHGSNVIPKKFILNHGGVKKSCLVVWQKGRRVGVAF